MSQFAQQAVVIEELLLVLKDSSKWSVRKHVAEALQDRYPNGAPERVAQGVTLSLASK